MYHINLLLVVRECQQKEGVDYFMTFSPVINNSCLKLLFAIAECKKLHFYDI